MAELDIEPITVIHTFYKNSEKRIAQKCGDTVVITLLGKTYTVSERLFHHFGLLNSIQNYSDADLERQLEKLNTQAEV